MRHDDDGLVPYDDDELPAIAQLPRELPLAPGELDRMTRRLRADGYFATRAPMRRTAMLAAAAVLVFVLGAVAGGAYVRRNSLEDMLVRAELSVPDRILLRQRAGSAYVRAAQGYADATARVDSAAVEVASRVLVGAANAVARNKL